MNPIDKTAMGEDSVRNEVAAMCKDATKGENSTGKGATTGEDAAKGEGVAKGKGATTGEDAALVEETVAGEDSVRNEVAAMCKDATKGETVSAASNESLSKSKIKISMRQKILNALIDSGSDLSFIHPSIVKQCSLSVNPSSTNVFMASTACSSSITGSVNVHFKLNSRAYDQQLYVLDDLCTDIILGNDFLSQHNSLILEYGGSEPDLRVCGLSSMNLTPPILFPNLTSDCKPVADKSRRYSDNDRKFISNEIQRMLEDDIIERSNSPWRAQIVVTRETESHKKRMCVDYSRTINKFTQLDAYPLPRIDDIANKIAQYNVFSTIDLKSAYHQVPLSDSDKPYTAFEAVGGLYQFKRMPFGLTNGVAIFQREMYKVIEENELSATFPYLDNVYICGNDQAEHDHNLEQWDESVKREI